MWTHSNAYGAAAGGGGAGGLSMEQRRKLLNQPRVVGAYQYSPWAASFFTKSKVEWRAAGRVMTRARKTLTIMPLQVIDNKVV